MLVRVISSVVGLPILIFFVYMGGYFLKAAVLVLALIACYELMKAFDIKSKSLKLTVYLFSIAYMGMIDRIHSTIAISIITILFTLTLCAFLVFLHNSLNIMDVAKAHFTLYYATIMLSMIYLVRETNFGMFSVWLIFISAFGCDTGAYLVGVKFGKRKLIPSLSPNKTVEGSFGGIFLATSLAAIYGFILYQFNVVDDSFTWLRYALVGVAGSIFAQFGDLSASAIKRYTKIKDFGHIMPGHGGVMDRFDSVLFTAPAVYLMCVLLVK